MASAGSRRVEILVPVRTLIVIAAAVGVIAAFRAIGDTFLIVFVGIFLALIYQQVENNILTPKIQGKAVRLSGFIIVAVTLFGALLGALGALTAGPLAATCRFSSRS